MDTAAMDSVLSSPTIEMLQPAEKNMERQLDKYDTAKLGDFHSVCFIHILFLAYNRRRDQKGLRKLHLTIMQALHSVSSRIESKTHPMLGYETDDGSDEVDPLEAMAKMTKIMNLFTEEARNGCLTGPGSDPFGDTGPLVALFGFEAINQQRRAREMEEESEGSDDDSTLSESEDESRESQADQTSDDESSARLPSSPLNMYSARRQEPVDDTEDAVSEWPSSPPVYFQSIERGHYADQPEEEEEASDASISPLELPGADALSPANASNTRKRRNTEASDVDLAQQPARKAQYSRIQ
ncbi:hypothetical protein HDK64DRAFT_283676 [Phyllosticta capitalensis]